MRDSELSTCEPKIRAGARTGMSISSGARAAYAKFIRRRDPRAGFNIETQFKCISRAASRRGGRRRRYRRRDYHNRAIIVRGV